MKQIIIIFLASISLITRIMAADEKSDFHRKVLDIRYSKADTYSDKVELEKKVLGLLNKNSPAEEKGEAYSSIAFIYLKHGWQGEKVAEKTSHYCEEALKYPLPPGTAAQLYQFWGSNLNRKTRNLKAAEYAVERVRVAKIYLSGLKIVLENLTAKDYSYPGVMKFDCPDNSQYCQELAKKHNQQMAVRKNAEIQNDFLTRRKELQERVIDLYAQEPYDFNEFNDLIKNYISDSATQDQMKQELQKLIERRKPPVKPDHQPGQRKARSVPMNQTVPNMKDGQ